MIDSEIKNLFFEDSIHKEFTVTYDGGTLTNEDLKQEGFSLTEGICEGGNLKFGDIGASELKLSIVNKGVSFLGKKLTVSIAIGDKSIQVGEYYVLQESLSADRFSRDLTAYDALYTIKNADVYSWYNSLTFPISMKDFRDSFFNYFDLTQETVELINDSIMLSKGFTDNSISGDFILQCICEFNATFCNVGRNGKLRYFTLNTGLLPNETLFPDNTLFPNSQGFENSVLNKNYSSLRYEDYNVVGITGLKVVNDEGAVIFSDGINSNVYTIKDNPLFYNLSSEVLADACTVILFNIVDMEFTPCYIDFRGNPCIELGDSISAVHRNGTIVSTVVLTRTLKGIQALMDSVGSKCKERQDIEINSTRTQISNIATQTAKNETSISGQATRIHNLEADHVSTSTITAINGQIDNLQTTKLSTSELSAEVAKLGYATVGQLNAVTIDASQITSGTISADRISADVFSGKVIAASGINVGAVTCSTFNTSQATLRPVSIRTGDGKSFWVLGAQITG